MLLILTTIGMIPSDSQRVNNNSHFTLQAISPIFDFSTYFGGSDSEEGLSIAVTTDGSFYVTGQTDSSDFPILNAFNNTYGGSYDAFITKFSTSGSILWSTFLGGIDIDQGISIAVTVDGGCCVAGTTRSNNFPTRNAFCSSYNGGTSDAFIAKFSAQGSLLWSTYFGGNASDYGYSIAIARDDSCYLTGYTSSNNFPTMNAFNSTNSGVEDAFITKFSYNGTPLWSTYFGGNASDYGYSIAIAYDDSCFITGSTKSNDLPTLNAYNNTYGGGLYAGDGYVAKFSTNGTLLWCTYIGGNSDDFSNSIAVATDNSCFLTGCTNSNNFPILNAYQNTNNESDAFIMKFSAEGSLLWSTYYGGNNGDFGMNVVVTEDSRCYVCGQTSSTNFPTLLSFNTTINGDQDLFISEFSSDYTLLWSTYLGGSSLDYGNGLAVTKNGNCYLVGTTLSEDFPTMNSLDSSFNGEWDAYVMKISRTSPQQLSSHGYYFFLIIVLIIPIVVILIRRKK